MSIKKLLVLSAAGIAAITAASAMAGGYTAAPARPSVYVDAHVGYAQVNWKDFNANEVMGVSSSAFFSPTENGDGGVTGGVDVGYSWCKYFAAEGGWFYLPEVKGGVTGNGTTDGFAANSTATISSWLAYAAMKMSVAVMDHTFLFGKFGVAYRSLDATIPAGGSAGFRAVAGQGHYWAPIFMAGMQYNWGGWIFGAQYLHLPGNAELNQSAGNTGAPDAAPQVNMYTAFVGYQFVA